MSVMFLKQLRLHRAGLESRLHRQGGASVDLELAQARQFLSATKDDRWRRQLIKRIKTLEEARKRSDDSADVQKRFKMVDELFHYVENHPDYNKTRKRRKPA